MILDTIVSNTRSELDRRKKILPLTDLLTLVDVAAPPRDYENALRGDPARGKVRLIAEIKRASPSKGVIRADLDVAETARRFEAGGADVISVLTDEKFFQGTLDDLREVVAASALPALRKDFLVDPYQVYEARAAGASSALLIVGILDDTELRNLIALQRSLGMEPQVEVHDAAETERALNADARIVGINNRDLRTFTVDLGTTEQLRPLIPAECVVISESGIHSAADVARLRACGVSAIHVGESLMTCPDPAAMIRSLLGTEVRR
ncbi:MAG TPA: indole-3-glycerol phosphate synthase TrpC [Chloroflexota bacterium]|nr:indole-3-glycerol phosphate synthase TrpC [Chloroflexota bacterium]